MLDELTNFYEHGHVGEVWFRSKVMETVASWTKILSSDVSQGRFPNQADNVKSLNVEPDSKFLTRWSVLDIETRVCCFDSLLRRDSLIWHELTEVKGK